MTTIKLIPQVMEIDVSLDSASMPSLFSQSMETTIVAEVDRQVSGRVPTAESVAERISGNRDFARKIRDWTVSEIDYAYIVQSVRDNVDYSQIIQSLSDQGTLVDNDMFMRALLNNSRFRNMVSQSVSSGIDRSYVDSVITSMVESATVNLANEIADKVLRIIQNKLVAGLDV